MNLKSAYSAQKLGLRLLKPSLVAPDGRLQPHHARQVGCVVGPVPLSLFNGCICSAKPAFPTKHPRQVTEGVTGSFVPIWRGRDFEGCLEMSDGFLCRADEVKNVAENFLASAGEK